MSRCNNVVYRRIVFHGARGQQKNTRDHRLDAFLSIFSQILADFKNSSTGKYETKRRIHRSHRVSAVSLHYLVKRRTSTIVDDFMDRTLDWISGTVCLRTELILVHFRALNVPSNSSTSLPLSTRCASYFGSLLYILYCIVLYALLCPVFNTRVTVLGLP